MSVLKFVPERGGVVFGDGGGDGGGYLTGEDGHGGRGGAEAAADRDGGGVLVGDEGGVRVDGVGREDSGQDSVSLETVEDSFSGGAGIALGGGYLDNEKIFLVYKEEEQK